MSEEGISVLRWETHDVKFAGERRTCLARLDYGQKWIVSDVNMTTRTFRDFIRRLAKYASAQSVEVKYMYDGEQQTEQDTVLLRLENYREQRNGYDFQRVLKAYGISINSFWNTAHS
jgi:hypothetical protein